MLHFTFKLTHNSFNVLFCYRLGYHYKRCPEKRGFAFKYELKAADQQIGRGAYSDGLSFLVSASKLAEQENEMTVVLDVISRAIEDIRIDSEQVDSVAAISSLARERSSDFLKLQTLYAGSANGFIVRYNTLRKDVLWKKEMLKRKSAIEIDRETSSDKKKELLLRANRNSGIGSLTFQLSYAHSSGRNSKASSADFSGFLADRSSLTHEEDNSEGNINVPSNSSGIENSEVPTGCCVIA